MRQGTIFRFEQDGVKVGGCCFIVDRNTLFIKILSPYDISQTLTIDPDKEALTETEHGVSELFAYAEGIMKKMYMAIKLIEREPDMFQRLYINFENMVDGQHIRFFKRVFHSETDRHYFLKDMKERIYESYDQLFDKYITLPGINLSDLKNTLTPEFLEQVMVKLYNLD